MRGLRVKRSVSPLCHVIQKIISRTNLENDLPFEWNIKGENYVLFRLEESYCEVLRVLYKRKK